ncbi:MAG: hypothetical protein A2091_00425 [Desulfuromonadales bacterium GWD2_61_12]|nr:MAG: hypothetical protein A2005_08450 [Desulfuromonadales bacterium GWC2_61_20]OGR32732.1 MAG: hypothetical protein A2091_00425 [Desulfuromonadales bacterium GWD2_61_12]HAD03176.1 two-component sensor histidine kinase [Desulfuromonas sp.]HBT83360.1 two-component sensor histidine kinase [Desulfuromonas sp.]
MRRPAGLYAEIIVSVTFLVGAALLLGGLLLLGRFEAQLLEARVAALSTQAGMLAASFSHRAVGHGSDDILLAELNQHLVELPEETGIISWKIFDRQLTVAGERSLVGEPILGPGDPALALGSSTGALLVRLDYPGGTIFGLSGNDVVQMTLPIRRQQMTIGVLQLRYSLLDVRLRVLAGGRLVFLYVLLYGAVLVGLGVWLFSHNIVRPVRRLHQATAGVAAGDLAARVTVAGPREIADLAEAFNAMTAALEQSRGATEGYIASLQQSNDELRRTQEELVRSEKMASVGQLAAGMAHEIGNPLGAVVGYLELLKADLPEQGGRELAERSLVELSRIDRLVRDLLDYARPEQSPSEPVEPAAVMAEAVELLQQQGALEGCRCQLRINAKLPVVCMSRHKLLQVLLNLLLNARDASPVAGEIFLTGGVDGNWVWLSVADCGSGMTPTVRSRLFDPFFTTKAPGKGRGLGLSICHRIINEAGGRIEVESQEGAGSRFFLWLPAAEEGCP